MSKYIPIQDRIKALLNLWAYDDGIQRANALDKLTPGSDQYIEWNNCLTTDELVDKIIDLKIDAE